MATYSCAEERVWQTASPHYSVDYYIGRQVRGTEDTTPPAGYTYLDQPDINGRIGAFVK